MASRLFNPSLFHARGPLFAAGLGASAGLFVPGLLRTYQSRYALRLDSSPSSASPKDWSYRQYQSDAKAPITRKNGKLNASAVRQMSSGSIIGLGVAFFSKSLALLLGLLVVGVQTAEHYGVRLIPYNKLQGYVKGVDLRSAIQDNAAFKLSFGTIQQYQKLRAANAAQFGAMNDTTHGTPNNVSTARKTQAAHNLVTPSKSPNKRKAMSAFVDEHDDDEEEDVHSRYRNQAMKLRQEEEL
nr:hypothetical protein CFP56_33495 [Quercus suber]